MKCDFLDRKRCRYLAEIPFSLGHLGYRYAHPGWKFSTVSLTGGMRCFSTSCLLEGSNSVKSPESKKMQWGEKYSLQTIETIVGKSEQTRLLGLDWFLFFLKRQEVLPCFLTSFDRQVDWQLWVVSTFSQRAGTSAGSTHAKPTGGPEPQGC